MAVPKFKVGDRVKIKEWPLSELTDVIMIKAIHIHADKITYTIARNVYPTDVTPMEVEEDELILSKDKCYAVIVTNIEDDGANTSFSYGSYGTKQEAEKARKELIKEHAGKTVLKDGIERVAMFMDSYSIFYKCAGKEEKRTYGIEEVY